MDKTIHETFDEIRDSVIEAWETMKEILNRAFEVQKEIEQEEILRETWRVPMNTCRSHQVMTRKPMVANIRSNL